MRRPVVGIIGNAHEVASQYIVQGVGMMNLEAVSSVSNAVPVIIPAIPSLGSVQEVISLCDGFVFTGGRPNVHPKHYGEEATEAHGQFDLDRDALTLPLIHACVAKSIPILGICRGFQEFNVAFGGTLHPEIRDIPGRINHRMPPDGTIEEKFEHRHIVELTQDGVFAELFGSNEILVNSLHGQGICQPGDRVVIEGRAPDNTPEAINIDGAESFALAVQWHPEWNAEHDKVSRPLFEA
ncbi:MAG: gamma-glutamyl-gamma-aminobutyrate hydrolase family protein, partial [Paracoccaceae bacterium]